MINIQQLTFLSKKQCPLFTGSFGTIVSKIASMKKLGLLITVCSLSLISCERGEVINEAEIKSTKEMSSRLATPEEEAECAIIVDYAQSQGAMMKMTRGNGSSGTSPLPGEASRLWLKGLYSKVGRVWIQQTKIFNGGNGINYNYINEGGVSEEDMLAYYSTTADSLIVTLTGYKSSVSGFPTGQAYIDFVRDNIVHYKTLFPKIKFITVGNEPNHPDTNESPAFYYEQGYVRYYKALNAANAILAQGNPNYSPILLGTAGFCRNMDLMLPYVNDFLALYKADTDPNKKMSFFNFHAYGESTHPIDLQSARQQIDNLMIANGLPIIPVFLTELGTFGGTTLPSGFTMSEAVTAQPACQLSKMFYLYEGVNGPSSGVSKICNWLTSHGSPSMQSKVELLDLNNGIASPYGNALVLAQKLSSLTTRIKGMSKEIGSTGLGTHVLASKKENTVYILVWNYNYDNKVATKRIKVMLKNIPATFGPNYIQRRVYVIDSQNNNYFNNPAQNTLVTSPIWDVNYYAKLGFLTAPLDIETNSVALIELTSH